MSQFWVTELAQAMNQFINILPGLLTAYLTYIVANRKSTREEQLEQVNFWRQKFEEADRARLKAESELAEERRKQYERYGSNQKEKGDI